jgi:hypothetical protein
VSEQKLESVDEVVDKCYFMMICYNTDDPLCLVLSRQLFDNPEWNEEHLVLFATDVLGALEE